ncbi:MAG: hypothetical protein KDA57_04625 [Planctomycetales bacterium]|nr:hypothetical protein [Planctomycetales bacterium]
MASADSVSSDSVELAMGETHLVNGEVIVLERASGREVVLGALVLVKLGATKRGESLDEVRATISKAEVGSSYPGAGGT